MVFYNKDVEHSSDFVPLSFKSMYKSLKGVDSDFLSYTVCPKCDSIFEYDDCILTKANGKSESKTCCHISDIHTCPKEQHVVLHYCKK